MRFMPILLATFFVAVGTSSLWSQSRLPVTQRADRVESSRYQPEVRSADQFRWRGQSRVLTPAHHTKQPPARSATARSARQQASAMHRNVVVLPRSAVPTTPRILVVHTPQRAESQAFLRVRSAGQDLWIPVDAQTALQLGRDEAMLEALAKGYVSQRDLNRFSNPVRGGADGPAPVARAGGE